MKTDDVERIESQLSPEQQEYVDTLKDIIKTQLYESIEHKQWFRDKPKELKNEVAKNYINEQILLRHLW